MTPEEFQAQLDKQNADKKSGQDKQAEVGAINKAGIKNVEATNAAADKITNATQHIKGKVGITNPDLAKTEDVAGAIDAINKLNITTFMSNPTYHDMATNMKSLGDNVQTLQQKFEQEGLTAISNSFSALVDKIEQISKTLSGTKVTVDTSFTKSLAGLQKSINDIEFNPQVTVQAPDTKIVQTPVDLKPIIAALNNLQDAIKTQKLPNTKVDMSPVIEGLTSVTNAINTQRFPVPNYVLPFKDSTGKAAQVQLDSSGNLPISASISGADGAVLDGANSSIRATVKNLSNSNPQAVAIVDSSGNQISSFGGGTQYTQGGATVANPTGTAEIWFDASGNPKGVTPSQPLPSNITNGTNIADVTSIASGNNALVVGGGFVEQASLSAGSLNADLVPSVDVSHNPYMSLQVTGTWSGTLAFQGSNDNTNFNSISLRNPVAGGGVTNVTGNQGLYGYIPYRYLRVRMTSYVSGTANGTLELRTMPDIPGDIYAQQLGAFNVGSSSATGSAVPANAFYIGINGSSNLTGISGVDKLGDGNSGAGSVATGSIIYNGSTFDRERSANAASNTAGTGLLGTGILGYDGTNWQVAGIADANSATTGINGASLLTSGTGYTTATLTLNSSTPNTSWYDMLNYASVSVEILTNTTPATLTFQTSGDSSETNISSMAMSSSASTGGGPITSTTSAVATLYGARTGRYFRVNSTNGAGSTTLVLTFFTSPSSMTNIGVNTFSGSATGSAVPANAFYMGMDNSSGNLTGLHSGQGDAASGDVILDILPYTYNGTSYDRQRSATAASNTTGTGLLGAGVLGWDGTNYQRATVNSTTYTSKYGLDGNLLGVLGTAFTTAGVVNVQGISGGTAIPENITQFGGTNISTGVGASGAGIPRVTVSNDSSLGVYINGGVVSLNTYELLSTTNATTTPTSTTCYVSSIIITVDTAGTTSTVTIADKSGTPVTLVNGLSTATAFLAPTIYNFQTPIKMTSGFTIVTAGAVAATVSIWVNYYQ